MPNVPDSPLGRIALCCSGGGYRAASFHLGAMSYLNRVRYKGKPLLENVKAISTVSGGTISGVVYALHKQRGKSFLDIYHFLLERLRQLDLIKTGLEKLNANASWTNQEKRRNLINAFAEIYDKEYTDGATFDVFDDMSDSHLEEVMFNSTEFNHGLIFRFQNKGLFGNRYNNVRRASAGEVKLSDIIAASSCFTGGFEPIEWPDDFLHSSSPHMKEDLGKWEKAGLMDGGIYDNQGIDSIIRSEARVSTQPFDMIIVSDVTSPYMDPFTFHDPQEFAGVRSLSYLDIKDKLKTLWIRSQRFLWLLMVAGLLLPLSVDYSNHIVTGIGLMLAVMTTTILFGTHWARGKMRRLIKDTSNYLWSEVPEFYRTKLSALDLQHFQVGRIEPLILDRIFSLSTLVMNVFLKTVRRLVYGRLYQPEKYQYRRMSNLIRELTEADYGQQMERGKDNPTYYQNLPGCKSLLKGDYDTVFGAGIKSVAEKAASFGTTLWFTEDDELVDMLDQLLASGQCSMCFNLLVYLTELKHTPGNGYEQLSMQARGEIDYLWDQCEADWILFKEDPQFLVQQLGTVNNRSLDLT